jgi:glycosyltransferase involved in cell wall biosynthesis
MTIHVKTSKGVEPTWSLAMIVRDAEPDIGNVLDDAAAFCDELVVVDTGSLDDTKRVAAGHGARVIDFEWIDDFAAARNASFENCRGHWILWLDADDRIPPAAQEGFARLKSELADSPDVVSAMIPYYRDFSAADPSVCTFSFDRERVLRRSASPTWVGLVHEVAIVSGPTIRWSDAWVEHRPRAEDRTHKVDRNLRILERAYSSGNRSPRTLFYLGNELRDHERWEDALAAYQEYLETSELVVWERHATLTSMAKCAERLGRESEARVILHEAIRLDSTRAEPFVRLGVQHYDRKEWQAAIPYFAAAAALQRPADGFIDDAAYTWAPLDYLAVCHSQLGRYSDAIEETVKSLRTAPDRERLLNNLRFYLDQLD